MKPTGLGGVPMRGRVDPQRSMLGFIDLEERVPVDHPLRAIKRLADEALAAISDELNDAYAADGRPSIPPERLLKASLLMALYSVRSERLFCEQLDYNLLFRWFWISKWTSRVSITRPSRAIGRGCWRTRSAASSSAVWSSRRARSDC